MAIQVWDGTKYVDAELGRFGTSGTPKEAFIWDGTEYVKVWPSSVYPLTGTFQIVNGAAWNSHEIFFHEFVESGDFTVTLDIESGESALYQWFLEDDVGSVVEPTLDIRASAGDMFLLAAYNYSVLNLSGTWSIVKN